MYLIEIHKAVSEFLLHPDLDLHLIYWNEELSCIYFKLFLHLFSLSRNISKVILFYARAQCAGTAATYRHSRPRGSQVEIKPLL